MASSLGGNTLTGFLVSKAMQSRMDAKKQDKKEARQKKKKEQAKKENKKQDKKQGVGSKLLGNLPSLGNLFSFKRSETKPESSSPRTRTSGGQTGLAQILTQGFGSLSADTLGLSSGLASVTQVLNSSLQAQSFTATGVQTIATILSDQLENQSSLLSTVKNLRSGGGSGGGKSGWGAARSKGIKGDTLTEALLNAAIERGIGRFISSRLSRLNPFNRNKPPGGTPGGNKPPSKPKGGYYDDAIQRSKDNASKLRRQGFMDKMKNIGEGFKGKVSQGVDAGKGLLGKGVEAGKGLLGRAKGFGDNLFNNPITRRLSIAGAKFGGRALPVAGTGFSAAEAADRAKKGDVIGAWLAGLGGTSGAVATGAAVASPGPQAVATLPTAAVAETTSLVADLGLLGYDIFRAFKPMSSGGVMVGESAGSAGEEVRPLNSMMGKQALGVTQQTDPGIQTSASTILATADEFIGGLPSEIRGQVSQSLGPKFAELTQKFGMSQTTPNLRIGGGKLKEDGNAKKTRDKVLEEMISGVFDFLGAKDKNKAGAAPTAAAPPANPGDTGTAEQQAQQQQRSAALTGAINNMQIPGKPAGTMGTTGVSLPGGGVAPATPDKLKPVVNGGNKFWFDKDGQIYHWQAAKDKNGKPVPSELKPLNKNEMGEGADAAGNLMSNQPESKAKRRFFIRDPLKGDVSLYQPSWMETSGVGDILNFISGKGRDEYDNKMPQGYYSYKWDDIYLGSETKDNKQVPKWKRASGSGDIPPFGGPATKFQRGGKQRPWWDFLNLTGSGSKKLERELGSKAKLNGKDVYWAGKNYGWQQMSGAKSSTMESLNKPGTQRKFIQDKKPSAPRTRPARTPVAATSQESSDMGSTTIINAISSGGGGSSIPVGSDSVQQTSNYISNPWPTGLAGVICTSPWSVV